MLFSLPEPGYCMRIERNKMDIRSALWLLEVFVVDVYFVCLIGVVSVFNMSKGLVVFKKMYWNYLFNDGNKAIKIHFTIFITNFEFQTEKHFRSHDLTKYCHAGPHLYLSGGFCSRHADAQKQLHGHCLFSWRAFGGHFHKRRSSILLVTNLLIFFPIVII